MIEKDRDDDARFWKLLAEASSTPSTSPLRSEEALAAFLTAHPLTADEEAEVAEGAERLLSRLSGRKPPERPTPPTVEAMAQMSDAEVEALFRNQGKSTPEIEKRLEFLRKKVREAIDKKKAKRPEPPSREGHVGP
jgi:hypothetical protein